jgi:hypothetical protein
MPGGSISNTLWVCTSVAGILIFHEATHLLAARAFGPISVTLQSYVPLRVQIGFEHEVTTTQIAIIALAPTLCGLTLAVIGVSIGLWQRILTREPYYLPVIILLNWVLYSLPSPADLRLLSKRWPSDQ